MKIYKVTITYNIKYEEKILKQHMHIKASNRNIAKQIALNNCWYENNVKAITASICDKYLISGIDMMEGFE